MLPITAKGKLKGAAIIMQITPSIANATIETHNRNTAKIPTPIVFLIVLSL